MADIESVIIQRTLDIVNQHTSGIFFGTFLLWDNERYNRSSQQQDNDNDKKNLNKSKRARARFMANGFQFHCFLPVNIVLYIISLFWTPVEWMHSKQTLHRRGCWILHSLF